MDPSNQWMSITGQPLNLSSDGMFLGNCTSINTYKTLNSLGEGAYGIVTRSLDTRTSDIVAVKQLLILPSERHNGIPITALREISILRSLKHQNIVNVLDVAVGEEALEDVYMVMEYCEQDMANLMDELKVRFTLSQVKCLARQLLEGLEYLHRNDIIHRDVKLQNILLTAKGVLKLADFGMSRPYSRRPLTPGVVTIWYRSPELLLGTQHYTPSVDLWSAGLIIGELLLNEPVLPGETPIQQLALIVKLIGTPARDDITALADMGCPELVRWQREAMPSGRADNLERRFRGVSSEGTVRFLAGLLRWYPRERWTASEALGKSRSRAAADAVDWWRESPRAADRELLPTFPEVRNHGESSERNVEVPDRSREAKKHSVDEVSAKESGGYEFIFGDKGVEKGSKRRRR